MPGEAPFPPLGAQISPRDGVEAVREVSSASNRETAERSGFRGLARRIFGRSFQVEPFEQAGLASGSPRDGRKGREPASGGVGLQNFASEDGNGLARRARGR